MASYNSYTGDGSQTKFAITFPFIEQAHVNVLLDGVTTGAWTWFDPSTIEFTIAPLDGAQIHIHRVTPVSERLAEFTNGEALLDSELNIAVVQALYASEEAKDRADQSIAIDPATQQYSFTGHRATDMADPMSDQDGVTKRWAETAMSSQLSQAIAARNAAVSAQGGSEAARDVSIIKANATAADVIATAADRAAVAADRTAVATDKGSVAADKATVSGYKADVASDKDTVSGYKSDVAADRAAVASDKSIVAADKSTVATDKATTLGYKNDAAASAAAAAVSAASVDAANLLTKSGNLSGLTDKSVARGNLDLGAAAVKGIATAADLKANVNTDVVTTDKLWAASKWQAVVNSTGNITIDASLGCRFRVPLVGNVVVDVANLKDGQPLELLFVQDATGGRTIGWASKFKWPGAQVPTVTTTANAIALVASCEGTWDANIVIGTAWKVA